MGAHECYISPLMPSILTVLEFDTLVPQELEYYQSSTGFLRANGASYAGALFQRWEGAPLECTGSCPHEQLDFSEPMHWVSAVVAHGKAGAH